MSRVDDERIDLRGDTNTPLGSPLTGPEAIFAAAVMERTLGSPLWETHWEVEQVWLNHNTHDWSHMSE